MAETNARPLTIRYFASVREGVGRAEETMDVPGRIATVGALVDWLRARDPAYEAALAETARIRAAVDRRHAGPETPIAGAGEVALFPMMTGG